MARWTADNVADYVGRQLEGRPLPALLVRKPERTPADYSTFALLVLAQGLPQPVYEYHFHPKRHFRLDIAWPQHKIGVEVEGGLWSKGRAKAAHAMPLGILRDMEKMNAATLLGWRVLRYTPEQLSAAVDEIAALFPKKDGS